MRLKMTLQLVDTDFSVNTPALERLFDADDMELAGLFYSSYHGSVDDEGESETDWGRIIQDFKNQKYGEIIADSSLVIRRSEELISGIVMGIEDGQAYIVSLVTKPEYRNKGLASCLVKTVAGKLKEKYSMIKLYVNEDNVEAISLYKKLGFEFTHTV